MPNRPRQDAKDEHPEDAFAYRLAEARRAKGLRFMDMAHLTGMRPNQVSRYETEGKHPGLVQLRRLADALEVSPSWLVYGTEKPFQQDNLVERLASMDRSLGASVLAVAASVLDRDDRRAVATLVLHLCRLQRGDEETDQLFQMCKYLGEKVSNSDLFNAEIDAFAEEAAERFGDDSEGGDEPSSG
jgi:transcriptional regulator with XRE-family HTH domain